MTTERVYRVAYVETTRTEEDVRFTFAQCGEIRGIYPFKTGDRQKNIHFFVEFDQQASVKRARALQLRDLRVHIIAYSPELVEHFMHLAPPVGMGVSPPKPAHQPLDSHGHPLRPWAHGKPYSPKSFSARKRKGARKDIHDTLWVGVPF